MKLPLVVLLSLTIFTTTTLAQGNQFKVRYSGGSVASTVKADDWGNTMTVSPEVVVLKLKDGQEIKIDPKDIKLMTHSRHASRRIGRYAALAVVSPLFLLGMLKKNKQHFIGIATETPDGKKNGYNVQSKNDQYRALMTALEGVTGMKVEVEIEEKTKDKK